MVHATRLRIQSQRCHCQMKLKIITGIKLVKLEKLIQQGRVNSSSMTMLINMSASSHKSQIQNIALKKSMKLELNET